MPNIALTTRAVKGARPRECRHTVDRVEGNRIKLKKRDSSDEPHKAHHDYIELGFVAGVEGSKIRVAANAATAVRLEEENSGKLAGPSAEA